MKITVQNIVLNLVLIALAINTNGQSYNYYFGNIHSHTGYSDGSKDSTTSGVSTPGQAYWFAKQTYHFDFLGISEHNHYSAGMVISDFAKGKSQSDTSNSNGTFVAMYGMEYGVIANGGHVLVYGIDSLIGWDSIGVTPNYSIYNSEYDYASLWSKIYSRSQAFCSLAHPSSGDYTNLDGSTAVTSYDNAVYGCAVRSGSAFSTTTDYSDAAATSYESMFKKYLALGYHLAPTIDADNHYTTFGRTNQGRTVVLARSLNRDSILAAFKLMHFYASDDWNAQVNFTVAGNMMGSDFQSLTNPTIVVTVTEPDVSESISNISIYRGILGSGSNATSVKSSNNVSTVTYNPTSFTINTKYYYYAKITEADGDIIWTAPIWFQKVTVLLPIEDIELQISQVENKVLIDFSVIGIDNNVQHYEIEKSNNLIDWKTIFSLEKNESSCDYSSVDECLSDGLNYYRIKAVLTNNDCFYSKTKAIFYKVKNTSLIVFPNPVKDKINVVGNFKKGIVEINFYTIEGKLLQNQSKNSDGNGNETMTFETTQFKNGTFLIDVKNNNERIYSGQFLKE